MEAEIGDYTPGDGWYDTGASVEIYTETPTPTVGERFTWQGWVGTGPGSYSGLANPRTITMNGPITEFADWLHELRLEVFSDGYGNPDPPEGESWFEAEDTIVATIDSFVYVLSNIRMANRGWVGRGSVPDTGETNIVEFVLEEVSVIGWQWVRQFRIDVDYTGTGEIPVSQMGNGWYDEYTRATVGTEPYVTSESDTFYFAFWTSEYEPFRFNNEYSCTTELFVDSARTAIATYYSALPVVVKKDPLQSYGSIILDGVEYPNADSVLINWGYGSVHTIEVSPADYVGDTMRYAFHHWENDSTNIVREVGPILSASEYIAYYHKEYSCEIRKEPAHDFGWLIIDREDFLGSESSYQVAWWEPGSEHTVAVSEVDSSEGYYHFFSHWSDGGERSHIVGPVTGPSELTAYYDTKYGLFITKSPPEPYGWFRVNGELYPETAEISFLAETGDSFNIVASYYDVGPDTVYYMRGWSDGTEDTANTVVMGDSPIYLTANYSGVSFELNICLSANQWNIGPVHLGVTRTMGWPQVITVENCGNYSMQLGLQITREGDVWRAGYYNTHNTFVLRARFEEEDAGTFDPINDFIKSSSMTWATSEIFGPGGVNIRPCSVGDCEQYLWLQFLAPTSTSAYTPQVIGLNISARVPMP